MDTSPSPTMPLHNAPFHEASPKPPYKKSFVTSLMEAATLHTPSFKEDTYFVSHLKSSEKTALQDLKLKLASSSEISDPSMWGIPLLGGNDKFDLGPSSSPIPHRHHYQSHRLHHCSQRFSETQNSSSLSPPPSSTYQGMSLHHGNLWLSSLLLLLLLCFSPSCLRFAKLLEAGGGIGIR
ncbi:patellin-6 [Senna tora]|uniref:Patellin-6 n=1 Tax=Senna tora TaxID=362788 RepID=A0A834X148_9FABA|nr:patellin-6 [Senna tora]